MHYIVVVNSTFFVNAVFFSGRLDEVQEGASPTVVNCH